MEIILRLDRVMADRKISSQDLAKKIGLTPVMLSRIKTGKIKAMRLTTLAAICDALDCTPGDILEAKRIEKPEEDGQGAS